MRPIDTNPAAQASLNVPLAPVVRADHGEGDITRLIEQQTAKVPSHWFLFGAAGAMAMSLALELSGRTRASRFVAHWPAPLLIMGVYNKIVKALGTR